MSTYNNIAGADQSSLFEPRSGTPVFERRLGTVRKKLWICGETVQAWKSYGLLPAPSARALGPPEEFNDDAFLFKVIRQHHKELRSTTYKGKRAVARIQI